MSKRRSEPVKDNERYATKRHAMHLQGLLKDRGVAVELDVVGRTHVDLNDWYFWNGGFRRGKALDHVALALFDTSEPVFVEKFVVKATPLDADTFRLQRVGDGTLEQLADRLKETLDLADAKALAEALE